MLYFTCGFPIYVCILINFILCSQGFSLGIKSLSTRKHLTTPIKSEQRKYITKYDESLDEIHDQEILNAVKQSMLEWTNKKRQKRTDSYYKRCRRKRQTVADNEHNKKVCYGKLGCFEDSGPFGYLDMLPSSPEEINTKFLFYSTMNRSDRPLFELPYLDIDRAWKDRNITRNSNTTMVNYFEKMKSLSGLDELPVKVIVHGFGSSCPHVWIYELRAALMAVENCVVICVDWENGANLPNYVRAAANTRLVGKQLAELFMGLQKYKGLELSRVHIIGFSLGAHVSGFAGAEMPGTKRITGLDPAGPLFESQHPKARLDSHDATFVDVVHSNGENLILGGLGSWQPMGHVDFYPNGGRVQHGCSNLFVGAVTDFIWSPTAAVEGRSLCNHRRAYKFFIDSVAPRCLFPAFPCDSYDEFLRGHCFDCSRYWSDAKCGNMGYYADKSTGRGQLYLVTRDEEPFCAHQFNIDIFSAENDLPLRTLGRLEAILEGDGSLNETFVLTDKDDTEFVAGELISRILVPHPALGFPHSISLTYKAYSGWLTKGLPEWTINKIVLTDSFGKSLSYCGNDDEPTILMRSGEPIYVQLDKINCDAESSTVDLLGQQTNNTTIKTNTDADLIPPGLDTSKTKRTDIFDMGSNFKLSKNNTVVDGSSSDQSLPWHPILDVTANSQYLQQNKNHIDDEEIGRSLSDNKSHRNEIFEPILKKTTTQSTFNTDEIDFKESKSSGDGGFFSPVQLLPVRLSALLERAEIYARETLLPLITEQAPRFLRLNRSNRRNYMHRHSDYVPVERTNESSISGKRSQIIMGKRKPIDYPPQNITINLDTDVTTKPATSAESTRSVAVNVDLPTFRPHISMSPYALNSFPYPFEPTIDGPMEQKYKFIPFI